MSVDKSLGGTLRQMRKDIDSLWGRIARTTPVAGTVALRHLTFPPPTTVADQADLANQQVPWWNTELGWQESYYAPTGSPGLNPPGLVPGVTAGWYPTGDGPSITLVASGVKSVGASWVEFDSWTALGNTDKTSYRNSPLLTRVVGYVDVGIAGRYDQTMDMVLPNGSGTVVVGLAGYRPSISAWAFDRQWGVPLQTGYGQFTQFAEAGRLLYKGDRPVIRVNGGSAGTVDFGAVDGAHLTVKYVAPPLVTS